MLATHVHIFKNLEDKYFETSQVKVDRPTSIMKRTTASIKFVNRLSYLSCVCFATRLCRSHSVEALSVRIGSRKPLPSKSNIFLSAVWSYTGN